MFATPERLPCSGLRHHPIQYAVLLLALLLAVAARFMHRLPPRHCH
jgi:hypothetical protein